MKTETIDIQYTSVEDAIETLQEYVGLNASLSLAIVREAYTGWEHVEVTVEIPEPKKKG